MRFDYMNRMMEPGFGYDWLFLLIWVILIVCTIGVLIYFFMNRKNTTNNTPTNSNSETIRDPMDIVKERYAKGELSKEEFEQLKKDLEK